MKIVYATVVTFGIVLGILSLVYLPRSPFVPFNWAGLWIFAVSAVVFVFSLKYQKILPFVLFVLGLLAMLNTYLYFKQCSDIKGIELFGGFFISLAPIFIKGKSKESKEKG